jgi:hypothetical protein
MYSPKNIREYNNFGIRRHTRHLIDLLYCTSSLILKLYMNTSTQLTGRMSLPHFVSIWKPAKTKENSYLIACVRHYGGHLIGRICQMLTKCSAVSVLLIKCERNAVVVRSMDLSLHSHSSTFKESSGARMPTWRWLVCLSTQASFDKLSSKDDVLPAS